jgi:hypothetical protein
LVAAQAVALQAGGLALNPALAGNILQRSRSDNKKGNRQRPVPFKSVDQVSVLRTENGLLHPFGRISFFP